MRTNTIYIKDWLEFHPYEKPQNTDFHYLKICNKVNEVFIEFGDLLFEEDVVENGKKLSCVLVTWFEDLVSEVGIWKAFINRHHQLYNKFLPFYNSDDYFDGEPNPQDIQFLIWYYLSMRFKDEIILSPSANLLLLSSKLIYDIFDEEWDNAPINHKMHNFLNLPASETDFYKIRFTFDWLVLNSYLFYFYGEKNHTEKIQLIEELKKEKGDLMRFEGILHGLHDDNVLNTITSLLAMKGKDWLAYILGEEHPLHKPLLEMSEKKTGRFQYLGVDDENIRVKHISSGKLINITRKSMEPNNLVPEKMVLTIGLVNWQNEWWFSGSFFIEDFDDDVLLEETSNPGLAGLFETEERKRSFTHEQYEIFLEFNNQKPIKYFDDKESLQKFMDDYFDFYNEKIAEKTGKKVPPKSDKGKKLIGETSFDKFDDDVVVFFNRNVGMEMAFGFNGIIPDPDNPYFDPTAKNKDATEFYFNKTVSKDMILYLSEKNCLPSYMFPGAETDDLMRENLDFVLRFYKKESYHAKAMITLLE